MELDDLFYIFGYVMVAVFALAFFVGCVAFVVWCIRKIFRRK